MVGVEHDPRHGAGTICRLAGPDHAAVLDVLLRVGSGVQRLAVESEPVLLAPVEQAVDLVPAVVHVEALVWGVSQPLDLFDRDWNGVVSVPVV